MMFCVHTYVRMYVCTHVCIVVGSGVLDALVV